MMPNRKRQQKRRYAVFRKKIAIHVESTPKKSDSIETGDEHIVPKGSRNPEHNR